MSDVSDDTDDEYDVDGSSVVRQLRAENKRLKAQADEARQAAEANPLLERRLAFAEAGLANHPMKDYFVKGYEGEMTPEAIRKAANDAGLPVMGIESMVVGAQVPQDRSDDISANRRMDDMMGAGTGGGDVFDSYTRDLAEAGSDWNKIDAVVAKYRDYIRNVNDDV
jgi:hypothetical protein